MRFKEYKTGQVIRFPVEESGKPPDAIEAFRRKRRKEKETSAEISEPEFLKNISDTTVIKNIIIKKYDEKKYSIWYRSTGGPETSDKPATFSLIRRTLKEPDGALEANEEDVAIIKSYIDFLIMEFVNKLDQNDLQANAELYKYAAKINEKVAKKKLGFRSTIRGEWGGITGEPNSRLHLMAGKLYETLSTKEKDAERKADFIHEAVSEYLAQILVYELKKELSQEDFKVHIKFISGQINKNDAANKLATTLSNYDKEIKILTDKVLKLSKIKS